MTDTAKNGGTAAGAKSPATDAGSGAVGTQARPKALPEMKDNRQIDIETGELLTKVMEFKKRGLRLSQACAAYYEGQYELSYSFADDATYAYYTLRLRADMDEVIPSITEIIPMAVFYENEMAEMYGVNIELISVDYHNKLYRIEEDAPLLPKEAKEEREANRENKFNNLRV